MLSNNLKYMLKYFIKYTVTLYLKTYEELVPT